MKRSISIIAALITIIALFASPSPAFAASRPNVVLIFADDLGWGNLGCYGASEPIRTPNIDRLAREGMRMTSGYVTASLCFPSRVGLVTGQYPSRFGIYSTNAAWYNGGMPAGPTIIAEPLQQAGYATAIIGKWHLGDGKGHHPLDRGFDYYFGYDHCCEDYFDPKHLYRNRTPVPGKSVEYLTTAFTKEAVDFINRHRDKPFFLYLPYNAVHGPRQAPERYREMFGTGRRAKDTFLGMLKSLDDGVGRVMAALRETEQANDTLVFFLTDNGGTRGMPGPNNGPFRGYKRTLWEGGVRVPYIVRWPGQVPAGETYDKPVLSLDIFPTILAATDVSGPSEQPLDGKNMLPALRGEREKPLHQTIAWAGAQHDRRHNPAFGERAGHAEARAGWAIRHGDWRLIDPGSGSRLYHLGKDPSEQKNLIEQYPAVAQELKKAYLKWFAEMEAPLHWPKKYWQGRLTPELK